MLEWADPMLQDSISLVFPGYRWSLVLVGARRLIVRDFGLFRQTLSLPQNLVDLL